MSDPWPLLVNPESTIGFGLKRGASATKSLLKLTNNGSINLAFKVIKCGGLGSNGGEMILASTVSLGNILYFILGLVEWYLPYI